MLINYNDIGNIKHELILSDIQKRNLTDGIRDAVLEFFLINDDIKIPSSNTKLFTVSTIVSKSIYTDSEYNMIDWLIGRTIRKYKWFMRKYNLKGYKLTINMNDIKILYEKQLDGNIRFNSYQSFSINV